MYFAIGEIPKSVSIQKHLTAIHIDEWMKHDVFHWRWWTLLCIIFTMLLVWWILVKKSKVNEICLFVLIATIMFMGVQEYGEELTLWDYTTDILPIFPPLSSINLLILPLTYSLVYQHYKTKKEFIWGTLIITAIICFIVEPLLSLGGFYHLYHWKYYYSFLIYPPIAVLIRAVTIKILKITKRNRCSKNLQGR